MVYRGAPSDQVMPQKWLAVKAANVQQQLAAAGLAKGVYLQQLTNGSCSRVRNLLGRALSREAAGNREEMALYRLCRHGMR
jgi:hypothetical protein